MSKYVIDTTLDNVKKVIAMGVTKGGAIWTDTTDIENLEELNSDYINEHFGDLQDTAYQKGFEDGKKEAESSEAIEQAKADAFNKGMLFKEEKIHDAYQRGLEEGKAQAERGCKGCEYEGKTGEHLPCEYCKNNFRPQWTAKADKIGVGDVVETKNGTIFAVTKITADGLVVGFTGDGSTCCFNITKLTKTGGHYNINEILGGLCDD